VAIFRDAQLYPSADVDCSIVNAIFNGQLENHLAREIAAAVLPLGLSPKVLPEFIGALAANNQKLLISVPGVTPQIIGAGVQALKEAYLVSFRYIWVAAGAFMFIAAIGQSPSA
jgi:hypothetical protein